MPTRSVHFWFAASAATFGLVASSARGDDWSQFRHDAQHTAFGKDKLRLPLTDIWTQRSRGECATWKGRVFYVGGEHAGSWLVCADLRTGAVLWRRSLSGDVKDITPLGGAHLAVTESGVLLVEDHVSDSSSRETPSQDRYIMRPVSFVRAFRVTDGAVMDSFPGADHNPPVPAPVIALDTLMPQLPAPRDNPRADVTPVTALPLLGPFAVQGSRLRCLTSLDLLLDWTLLHPPGMLELRHWFVEGEAGREGILSTNGYPPAANGESLVIAGEVPPLHLHNRYEVRQTFGMLSGTLFAWHYDYPFAIGIPTVSATNVLTSAGHDRTAVMAHDASNGAVRWTFAPTGLYPDNALGQGGGGVYRPQGQRPVLVIPGPLLNAHAVWTEDPGLVLDDRRIYATVTLCAPPSDFMVSALNSVSPYSRVYFNTDPPLVMEDRNPNTGRGAAPGPAIPGAPKGAAASADRRATIGQILVALDESTGQPLWSKTLSLSAQLRSLIGTKDHLILSTGSNSGVALLEAFRKEDGKQVWALELTETAPGPLAFADGLLFAPQSEDMTMFAPAERTFHLAVDSNRKEDYQYVPAPDPERDAEEAASPEHDPTTVDPTAAAPEPKPKRTAAGGAGKGNDPAAANPVNDPTAVADATVIRLHWGDPLPAMLQQIQTRLAITGDAPVLLSLDWLSPDRSHRSDGAATTWNAADSAAFADLCGRLAREAKPEHFDLAPDLNVFLARYPAELATVRSLLQAARKAVLSASPDTLTLLSLNAEVLNGVYGKGRDLPFGKLPAPDPKQTEACLTLLESVDEVGLTSQPLAGFWHAEDLPGDYFFGWKEVLGGAPGEQSGEKHRERPILVTALSTRLEEATRTGHERQESFLKHLVQCCYWLNAKLVVFPDIAREPGANDRSLVTDTMIEHDLALRVGKRVRPALAVWQSTLHWREVDHLSSPAAKRRVRLTDKEEKESGMPAGAGLR